MREREGGLVTKLRTVYVYRIARGIKKIWFAAAHHRARMQVVNGLCGARHGIEMQSQLTDFGHTQRNHILKDTS